MGHCGGGKSVCRDSSVGRQNGTDRKGSAYCFLHSGCYFDSVCRVGVVDGGGPDVYLVAVGTNVEDAGQF